MWPPAAAQAGSKHGKALSELVLKGGSPACQGSRARHPHSAALKQLGTLPRYTLASLFRAQCSVSELMQQLRASS